MESIYAQFLQARNEVSFFPLWYIAYYGVHINILKSMRISFRNDMRNDIKVNAHLILERYAQP